MALPQAPHLSWEEYLAAEETAGIRYELVGGVAFAMSGGTLCHSMLSGAIYAAVRGEALAEGCRPHNHVMKLKVGESTFYYPDVMVVCRAPVHDGYEAEPVLLVEVSSPSSLVTDRREKVGAYLAVPSLQTYLVFDQHQPAVEIHERLPNGRWLARGAGSGEQILLPYPAVALNIDDLYAGLPD